MSPKRLAIGSVVGMVGFNGLAFLLWGVLVVRAHEGAVGPVLKNPPVVWALLLGGLLVAAGITLALEWSGASSILDAVKGGVVLALTWAAGYSFFYYSVYDSVKLTELLVDAGLGLIQFAGTAAAISAAVGMAGGGATSE